MNTKSNIDPIAVIGVSDDTHKYGYKVFRHLIDAGHPVYPIHLAGGAIDGVTRFATLADLPETPKLVVTVVPPIVTEEIVRQCVALNIPAIWMQPGSESDAAIAYGREHGLTVTAHACIMLTP
jgi:uncharacterized protein